MKKRILCTLLAMSMVYSMAGCAASSDSTTADSSADFSSTASTSNTAAQTSYSGTVTAISSSSITVSTDSGDSVTAAINDSTTITRGGPGGMGGDDNAPQMPGGDSSSGDNGGTPQEKPDGDSSDANGQPQGGDASGNAPQAPNGSSDSGSAPQGKPPEKPDGDSSNAPADGNAPADVGAPADPNGSSDGSAPQMPQDGPDDARQSLTTDDIAVGDTVTLTLNADGTADSIVLGGDMVGPGSGTMVVDGGSYTSNGIGSPAIYSTADITVNDAELTANGSEAICIEGLNTIRLFDCDLTGSMADNSQNDCTWNVILYQSMSGDSEVGNSTFEMVGGSLTAKNGGMFYTTNTESTFLLQNVAITNADDSEFFLKCTGNANQRGWGTTGQNGADCSFTARQQEMTGDVIWDSISQLDLYVLDGSTLTGAVLDDESNAGNGGDGYAALYLGSTSKWVVTGDSTVTSLYNAGTIVDASGNTVSVVGTDGTVYVQGTSQYTVTVTSYSTSVDTSAAATADSWSDYEVEKA